MPEYITVKETAELLRKTPDLVRKMCREGKLPAKKISEKGDWIINHDKLRKLFLP